MNVIQAILDMNVMTVVPDFIDNRNLDKPTIEERIPLRFAKAEVKSKEGKALLGLRGSQVERSFAQVLDSGGQQRTTLSKNENILKRYRIAVASYNLSLLMRKLFGIGTPKQSLANSNFFLSWILNCIWRFQIRLLDNFSLIFYFFFTKRVFLKLSEFLLVFQFLSLSTGY